MCYSRDTSECSILVNSSSSSLSTHAGLKSWKVGSRKIYAIKSSVLCQDCKHQRKIFTISDSSDSDGDFLSNSKRQKLCTTHSDGQLESLKTEVKEMRQDMQALFEINKWMKVPVGL